MFTLGFIGLTILYVAIAICITYGIAKHNDVDPVEYLENNNTWFFVLVGASAVTFVIACFNFGPAVLLPENFPTTGQRSVVNDVFNHLLYGKNAPAKSVPTEPLPWATGTWFWWKAFGLYVMFTIAYIPFAFWDEVKHVFDEVRELLRKRRETRKESSQTSGGHDGEKHDVHEPSFKRLLGVEFTAETVMEIGKLIIAKFFTKRRSV
jgi:hypothetical protein